MLSSECRYCGTTIYHRDNGWRESKTDLVYCPAAMVSHRHQPLLTPAEQRQQDIEDDIGARQGEELLDAPSRWEGTE